MVRRVIGRRRGATMMIVMVVVGIAAVLGFAMVQASTLQATSTGSMRYAATAEYLADSGAQAALYYLQNPGDSPVALVNGRYPGQTGMTFGSGVPGRADVTVAYSSGKYTITSKGYATTADGSTIAKTVTAVAEVIAAFTPRDAAMFDKDVKFKNATIIGPIETNGSITVDGAATHILNLAAPVRGTSFDGQSAPVGWSPWGSGEGVQVPQFGDIKDYTGSYKWLGGTFQAKKITSASLALQVLPSVTDLLTNPAGVYYTDGDLDLGAVNVITGTLIVKGKLTIKGTGNIITAKPGFPTLVVKNDIVFSGLAPTLTATGMVYTGGSIKGGPSGASMTVVGALIAAGSNPIDSTFLGSLALTYDLTKLTLSDFTSVGAVPTGVRVVSWNMN
jgi:hypothetical protein